MSPERAQQREQLVADIRKVMAELDELVRDSGADVGDELAELKGRLQEQVSAARETLSDLESRVSEKARDVAIAGDAYVRDHTWTSIGVAAGIGVVIGLLLNRR
jgi:ElaB/YqjD/DUF883 family membrane-anchored ribosome-binding protein